MGSKKKTMSDFKVIKKKIGKKAKPANETSTKFQSKQIILREQSVVTNLNSEENAVSSRGLTVDQLVNQTRHYNPKIRKEAFAQLHELAQRFEESNTIRKSFTQSLEALADNGMRDLDQGSRRAFQQVFTTLVQRGFPITAIHSTTIINVMFVCLTEGEGIDRRLDSTRILDLLLTHTQLELTPQTIVRLIPCFADLCRTVLGTNSSSLAKREAGVILRKGTVGKIMEQMKEAEKQEKLNKKLKQSKTTQSSIALENAFDTERLLVVSRCVVILGKLLPKADVDFDRVLLPLLLAVLEVFRHACELNKPDAFVPCAEALWRIVDQCAQRVSNDLCDDICCAFTVEKQRFDLKRFEVLTCIALHQQQETWFASCLQWFLSNKEVQDDKMVNEKLWFTVGLLSAEQRAAVLQCFTSGFSAVLDNIGASPTALQGVWWRLSMIKRVVRSVDRETRLVWCQGLPRALWTLSGGSVLDMTAIRPCGEEVERIVALGFDVLRECALLEDQQTEETKEWVDISRSMSSFYAGMSAKQQAAVLGPFFRYPSWLRTDLVSFLHVLPVKQLPNLLLKNWCQTLLVSNTTELPTADGALLIETAFYFASKLDNAEMILSFALTCALKTKHTTLVCDLLKSLWRSTRWPIATLIAPAVIDSQENTVQWIEFSATVLSIACDEGEDEQVLRALQSSVCKTVAEDWSLVRSTQVLNNLSRRFSPQDICQHSEVSMLGWVEFLLVANQQSYDVGEWSWGKFDALQAKIQKLALKNPKLASDLKLLLLDQE